MNKNDELAKLRVENDRLTRIIDKKNNLLMEIFVLGLAVLVVCVLCL